MTFLSLALTRTIRLLNKKPFIKQMHRQIFGKSRQILKKTRKFKENHQIGNLGKNLFIIPLQYTGSSYKHHFLTKMEMVLIGASIDFSEKSLI